MVVLDTSALIYWTLLPERLSERAAAAVEQADQILVSSISIWEIALKAKQGRLILPLPVDAFLAGLKQTGRVKIQAVSAQNWLDNVALAWDHRDPADRTIVALALRNHCPLITSDQRIADFYPATIW